MQLDDCVLRDWLLSSVKQGWIEGFLSVSMKLFPLNIKVFCLAKNSPPPPPPPFFVKLGLLLELHLLTSIFYLKI